MTETGRVHLINFLRKLALTAVYFLAPLRFLDLGLSGAEIGLVVALLAAAAFGVLAIPGEPAEEFAAL